MKHEGVVIVDFGQNARQVARSVREAKVYCEIVPCEERAESIIAREPKGIILIGGTGSIKDKNAEGLDNAIFESGIPILGIGYGAQYIAAALGGGVADMSQPESGTIEVSLSASELHRGLSRTARCRMEHLEAIDRVPLGFVVTAHTTNCFAAAMEDSARRIYAVQYHPEDPETSCGAKVIENFVTGICGCAGSWTMKSYIEQQTAEIRAFVGDKKVICAMSGGVDSSVSAALVHRAVGDNLTCIFVDHGLLRKDEAALAVDYFSEQYGIKIIKIDASDRFLNQLKGVTDPEKKRKIIGKTFIDVFEEQAKKLGGAEFLVQGTIYPDIIESGSGKNKAVKSHHNVGGLPEHMKMKLVEPVRELFKDEVRRLGTELGIPEKFVNRQPFPGPGLGVRCLGEITREKLAILREADYIFRQELEKAGYGRKIWQYFAVLPNIQSVGVERDERTYMHTIALRAINSTDAMTADWARIPLELLAKISDRIVGEVSGVNRVVYDITRKPPATIEYE